MSEINIAVYTKTLMENIYSNYDDWRKVNHRYKKKVRCLEKSSDQMGTHDTDEGNRGFRDSGGERRAIFREEQSSSYTFPWPHLLKPKPKDTSSLFCCLLFLNSMMKIYLIYKPHIFKGCCLVGTIQWI